MILLPLKSLQFSKKGILQNVTLSLGVILFVDLVDQVLGGDQGRYGGRRFLCVVL